MDLGFDISNVETKIGITQDAIAMQIRGDVNRVMTSVVNEIAEVARELVPVYTGDLESSIRVKDWGDSDGLAIKSVVAGGTYGFARDDIVWYAYAIETGAIQVSSGSPHYIQDATRIVLGAHPNIDVMDEYTLGVNLQGSWLEYAEEKAQRISVARITERARTGFGGKRAPVEEVVFGQSQSGETIWYDEQTNKGVWRTAKGQFAKAPID